MKTSETRETPFSILSLPQASTGSKTIRFFVNKMNRNKTIISDNGITFLLRNSSITIQWNTLIDDTTMTSSVGVGGRVAPSRR